MIAVASNITLNRAIFGDQNRFQAPIERRSQIRRVRLGST